MITIEIVAEFLGIKELGTTFVITGEIGFQNWDREQILQNMQLIYGLLKADLKKISRTLGVFADRVYLSDGFLMPVCHLICETTGYAGANNKGVLVK